ncbi:MAG: RNA polymerase factor sigma-54 [Pseudomonadota bacterium]
MAIAQRLDLRQSQQLVMTPQLQQAIKMLQMSNLELRDFIAQELERNPLLEAAGPERVRGDGGAEDKTAPGEAETPAALSASDRELAQDRLTRADETFDTGAENIHADEAYADRMDDAARAAGEAAGSPGEMAIEASAWSTVGKGGSSKFEDAEHGIEATLTNPPTLREHLLKQLGECGADTMVRLIASDLIENLDETGYLRVDLAEVAERLGAPLEAVNAAAALLRGFDPTGVGARDLKECLALQLLEANRLDPAMETLLDNLDLLAARNIAKLLKLCRVDAEDLKEMIAEIRALDPKPGLKFEHDVTQAVSPDVFVYEKRDGGWAIELNTETLPRLLVNSGYAAEVVKSANGKCREVKEYLAERQQSANWLMKSIDQRAKTILRVAAEIVRQQDGFLAYGVTALRPLNLKTVADAIEMHESTVSRVTSNKYVSTPRGVFELKYFFTPAIASTDGGEAYSAEAIRHRIRRLIEAESGDDVLSDDRIVAILREDGVDIARRTVAKYREALRIPSSVQRRKLKLAEAAL